MYKSFKITEYNPISPAPKPFGTEEKEQATPSKHYESISRLIIIMDKTYSEGNLIYQKI